MQLFLVEDEIRTLDHLDTELSHAGFDVVVAANGAHALAEIEANGPWFGALVIDIDLGSGPDGWEVSRRARELDSHMPVVYITGDHHNEWTSKGVPNSVLVTKPFAAAKLIAAVSGLLPPPALTEQTEGSQQSSLGGGVGVPFTAFGHVADAGRLIAAADTRMDGELRGYRPSSSKRSRVAAPAPPPPTAEDVFPTDVNPTRLAIVVSDPRQPDNPIVYANAAFFETTGYTPEEVIGRNCRFLQGPATDPAAIEQIRRALANQEKLSLEILNYRKDGRPFWTGLFLEPIYDRSGVLTHWFASQTDNTQRDFQQNPGKAEPIEALRQLARGIAHDSNNLMQVVLSNLASLRSSEADERRRQQIDAVTDAIERGGSLTQQLVAFSTYPSLSRTPTNMSELVEQLTDMTQTAIGRRYRITVDLAPDLWIADVDAGLARTNLLNLIRNAHDAMPDGGHITLTTGNYTQQPADRRVTGTLNPGRYVLVTVHHNGTRTGPGVLNYAMMPNFAEKAPAMGGGTRLAMVFDFMRRSGGDVLIASELGIGTTVSLYFPAFNMPA